MREQRVTDADTDRGRASWRESASFDGRIEALLGDARQAGRDGDWAALLALTTAVLALDPGNAEAIRLRAGGARRRQMTLLFCDIVGSTALADSRDPEDTTVLLAGYRALCARIVEGHGGVVDDHQGDGMLALFGYPAVREDDVQRAVLCGLALVRAIRDESRRAADPSAAALRVRVAVHTDLVVLDGVGVTGATSNEAARIQSLAEPGTVVISDATEVIVRGLFDTASRGRVELRGVSRPVELFTVLGERKGGRRVISSSPSPFVGRHGELDRLRTAWRRSTAEQPPTEPGLLVTGPPGVGKSRLLTEAAEQLGAATVECRCSRYHGNTSLFPLLPLLERVGGINREDDAARRLDTLRSRLARLGEDRGDLPFLAAALRIPVADLEPDPDVDPARLRDRGMQAAATLVLERAAETPLMVIVDDVQWADRSTLELISMLLVAPHPGLLLLLAAREAFDLPWPPSAVCTLQLDRLTEGELTELADQIMHGSSIPAEQQAELVGRSDGIPLFLEELVRTAEAHREDRVIHRSLRLSEHGIPAALRDPLLARLVGGDVDLALAQIAATIGREVDRDLLRRTAGLSGPELDAGLRGLVAARLVEPAGAGVVRFRHELVREVAYETQPREVRRARHGRIADQLRAQVTTTGRIDTDPVVFHLERARRYREAVEISLQAANADQGVGAHAEVIRRMTEVLRMIDKLPTATERRRAELAVREVRGFSAVSVGGYAAPEAAEDHRRCLELCEQDRLPELLPSLIRTWSYFTFRGDLDEADRVTDRIDALGLGELSTLVAEAGRGVNGFYRGRFGAARDRVRAFAGQGWAHSVGRPPAEWPLPHDPLSGASVLLSPIQWVMGEPAASAEAGESALRRASGLRFPYGPFSLGYVQHVIAATHRMAGDHEAAGRLGEQLVALGERHGFTIWKLAGSIQLGLTAARSGQAEALARLTQDVSIWRMLLVADLWSPYWLTEVAAVHAATGERGPALRLLDDAVAITEATGSAFYLAETLRRRGELRCADGDPEGMTDLVRALAVAREQGATVFRARIQNALGLRRVGCVPA